MKNLFSKIKFLLRLFLNYLNNLKRGYVFRYARMQKFEKPPNQIRLTQELKPNSAKVHNLELAASSISSVLIEPNRIFSFWKAVGRPTQQRGFVESRSIVGNEVRASVGGGLCQLSGLIYYLSLTAGLEIIERHNHSIDIYTEQTRFTPLGSDATVAYGYKDLKLKNNFSFPISFSFVIDKEEITVELNLGGKIEKCDIDFRIKSKSATKIEVETYKNDIFLTKSVYRLMEKQ